MKILPLQFSGVQSQNNVNKTNSGYLRFKNIEDTVTFTKRDEKLLSQDEGIRAANKFKTSTSGYRGSIHDNFNDKFVYSMTNAVIKYLDDNDIKVTLVGGDTREATKKYSPKIQKMFEESGKLVYVPRLHGMPENDIVSVPTPVMAVVAKKYGIPLAILLTASHNPWDDGGYNFLTDEGAIADERITEPLANNLEEITKKGIVDKKNNTRKGLEITFDPYRVYSDFLKRKNIIDFDKIKSQDIDIFYEDFGGTGGFYFPYLLTENGIKLDKNNKLSTHTKGPNPNEENLKTLSSKVQKSKHYLKVGLANDGDSDRFGLIDENGKFISADDVILLASYHAIKNKGMKKGSIVTNQASNAKIQALCDYFNKNGCNITTVQTPVGFKYLSRVIEENKNNLNKRVIIAGEESGGLTIRDNVPEKDGFVALLLMLELIASEKKPIGEILSDINDKIGGNFVSKCVNVEFESDEGKNATVGDFTKYVDLEDKIAGIEIDKDKTKKHLDTMLSMRPTGDGTKIYLKDGSSVLVRKSGTEPIVRLYINGVNSSAFEKLKDELTSSAFKNGGKVQK